MELSVDSNFIKIPEKGRKYAKNKQLADKQNRMKSQQ